MIYNFLTEVNKEKFDKKYEELRIAGKVREATEIEAAEYYNKNYDKFFEAYLNEDKCRQIGVIYCGEAAFCIGISPNQEILLFDKLSKFLKIKV